MTKPNVASEWLPENFFLFLRKKKKEKREARGDYSQNARENVTRETPSGSCVCCAEHRKDHLLQNCSVLRTSAGAEWSIQGSLGSPARLSVLSGQTPWDGFHTNFSEAKATHGWNQLCPISGRPLSPGGEFCSSAAAAAAASCLVSKDSASDKSWEEAAGSAMKSILLGGKNSAAVKRMIQADKDWDYDNNKGEEEEEEARVCSVE